MIFDISNNTKSTIFAIDGCHDRIFIWVARFGYLHESFQWNSYSECTHKSQHVLCIGCLVYI
jgi:hypothetical protein